MSDYKIDPKTGDLALESSDIVVINTKQDLARQRLAILLNTLRGEWEFNVTFGIPYISNKNNKIALLGSGDLAGLDLYIKTAITNEEYVELLESYQSTFNPISGELTVSARVRVYNGEAIDIVEPLSFVDNI